ncbi:MAG: type II toxin-antitoxin system RelE/ParE family toxin [Methanofollis sp.]|nr:type II toxin-antitoxin system RelE/ParE family toxin [Methanofollis sp.]
MTYTVTYTRRARHDLRKLPPQVAQRIVMAVSAIKESPYTHLRKMGGFSQNPVYRLRVGEYRVILTVEDEHLLILVLEARHRSRVYRKY